MGFFSFSVLLQMWPDLIQKAKDGGLDVIQTYVFWNGHEPSPGKVMANGTSLFWDFSFIYMSYNFTNYQLSILFIFFFPLYVAVLFWGELWSGEVHQAGAPSWPLCSSKDRSLYLCWVELWVNTYTNIVSENSLKYYISSTFWNLKQKPFFIIFRGFPVWLKYIPGINFRTDNGPFKVRHFSFLLKFSFWISYCFHFTYNLFIILSLNCCKWRPKCKSLPRRLWIWWKLRDCLSLKAVQ